MSRKAKLEPCPKCGEPRYTLIEACPDCSVAGVVGQNLCRTCCPSAHGTWQAWLETPKPIQKY